MLHDALVTCPCCWEQIPLEVDVSAGSAQYTEDCPVCCRPMAVTLAVDESTGEFTVQVEPESG